MFASTEGMLIVGIDPGLTRTGFGAVKQTGSSVEVVAAGIFHTSKELPAAGRLESLYADITELIEEVRPRVMAMERVFTNRNRLTATRVGQASGVVMLAAAQAGIEVYEYSPSAVKAIVTGDGSASKIQVQQMVARRLGLVTVPSPADIADALAIALCHMQSTGNRVGRLVAAHGGR